MKRESFKKKKDIVFPGVRKSLLFFESVSTLFGSLHFILLQSVSLRRGRRLFPLYPREGPRDTTTVDRKCIDSHYVHL